MPRYDGMEVIDRPDPNGPVLSWLYFVEARENEKTYLRDGSRLGFDRLRSSAQLHFLSSLKDQYSGAYLVLPGGLQLNRLLKEDQIPHRPVEHSVARAKPYTRMQIRVLDHKRVLESMQMPAETKGKVTVAIRECEGTTSAFQMDFAESRIAVMPSTQSPDLECTDVMWASLMSGDISAGDALHLGLIKVSSPQALRLLGAFSEGPAPFCQEYF